MAEREKILAMILEGLKNGEIRGVSIDSRNIREGQLFVALKGERFDGHDFVPEVIGRGAWGALVARSALESKAAVLGALNNLHAVNDTLAALQELSHRFRRQFSFPVIGITGSNGKTTTKEMLAGILERRGPVLKNAGNLNNHIGVPLTLLKFEARHTAAVVEMGMSALREIDLLARLTSPDTGVITNIGPAHLEFLGTLENVAEAKGELLDNVQPGGTAVLNADDRFFARLAGKCKGRVISFGIDAPADVRARDIRQERDFTAFTIEASGLRRDVRLRAVGRHNVQNALAAAAAAVATDLSLDDVKAGLDGFVPVAMRSEIKGINGRTVLVDYYNANPASMEAALVSLMPLARGGKAVALLGDMLELGESSLEAHRAIGRIAARTGVAVLITFGDRARHIAEGARDEGMAVGSIHETLVSSDAARLLHTFTKPGDTVLIKGSRGMKMEKILEEF